tara:strand:- start:4674 stop:5633 length:960 start_codon:yes stop_codon:yes gene_type:complete
MKGVFLDLDTVKPNDLDLSSLHQALPDWEFFGTTAPENIVNVAKDAEVIVTNKVVLNETVLSRLPRLQLICVAATGYNNIDLDSCARRGITVTNVRGYCTSSVVQHTFAMILALASRLPSNIKSVSQGRWQASQHFCLLDHTATEVSGKTLGIVGYGELGKAIAKVAPAFGLRVLLAQRPNGSFQPGRMPLEQMLPATDILTLHCPLNRDTRGLIGEKELRLMKRGSLIINNARGGIVDEKAIAQLLRQGHLGGAALDVLAEEPPRSGHPLLAPDIPNLILTPHIAWASNKARQALIEQIASNITTYTQGEPKNVVAID